MNKNTLMLLIAAALGVVATLVGVFYLQTMGSKASGQQQEIVQMVDVVVAKADLPAGMEISTERDLETLEVPADSGSARSAFPADNIGELEGLTLTQPILAGAVVMYSSIRPIIDMDFPRNMRAVTVPVSEEGLIGGLLVPGDRVDVLVSRPKPQEQASQDPSAAVTADPEADPTAFMNQLMAQAMSQQVASGTAEEWESMLVVENVRVIAVGRNMTGNRLQIGTMLLDPDRYGEFRVADNITLEVTLQQAITLNEATAGGSNPLTILMRSPREEAGSSRFDEEIPG
ncbi:MAG: Flp pilus assembly protein CpaB [Planctomycetota bacterium]